MRRPAIVAVFAFVLAALPAFAQRGGGHASGGGHAGGMHSGSGAMSHGFAGSRQSFSHQSFSRQAVSGQSFSRPSGLRPSGRQSFAQRPSFVRPGSSRNRAGGTRFRSFGSRNRFGYGYGYPWANAGFYDPYWWWDSGSSYDEDRGREMDRADQMNQQNLEEQQMRQQGDQDAYAQSAPQQDEGAPAASAEAAPPTVLVFRDQRKQDVQNYAIVGQTLWNFSAQRTQKIPIGDLDLTATIKANEERGVDFRLPVSPEGQ
jgi:hypothetical protein